MTKATTVKPNSDGEILAIEILKRAVKKRGTDLAQLVADTALWVSPECYKLFIQKNGSSIANADVRRAKSGEKRGQVVHGVRLDDNTYANLAIKSAMGHPTNFVEFETCHVWPKTCYENLYHTELANLVLLPRAIASLSDFDEHVVKVLQYRAFELYGWYPKESVTKPKKPKKPNNYPQEWLNPICFKTKFEMVSTDEFFSKVRNKLKIWSKKPSLNVHKIIALVQQSGEVIRYEDLVEKTGSLIGSKNPEGAVRSLMTNTGNAYGHVFALKKGKVSFRDEFLSLINELKWHL